MAKNLPIDNVVMVDITRESAAPETADFDSYLFIGVNADEQNPKIPQAERVREFVSASEVGQVFGTTSDIYKAAVAYFGQEPKPTSMKIGLRYGGTDAPPVGGAKVLGNPAPFDQETWRAVKDGAFSFTYNGVLVTIQNLNFETINDGHDVAGVVNSAFNNLTPENPNVTILATASAVFGENVWVDSNGQAYQDLNGNYWLTHIAPSGELVMGFDSNSNTFFIVSTQPSKNFTEGSFGGASQGTDITGTTLLNLQTATVYNSQMLASSAIAQGQSAITSTEITALKAISSGTLNMDGTGVGNLDFTNIDNSVGAYQAAAILSIQAGLTLGKEISFTVVDGKMNVQTISGTQFGAKLDISPATDTSKALFGSSATEVDTKSDFLESLDDALVAIEQKTSRFYGIGAQRTPNLSEASINQEILTFSQSVQARTKMYFANLYDPTMYSASQDDIGSQLATKSLFRTVPCGLDALSDGDLASAAAGKLLPTVAGSSTLFGKTLPTISASNQGQNGQNLALEKNINVYSEIASISMFREGTVCGTSPEYADVIRGIDWLTYEIQKNIFAKLVSVSKIPYTDGGVRILVQQLEIALNQGVTNGLIAGDIVDGKEVPAFTITAQRVSDVPLDQRQRRVAPTINFTARLAGAIQKVNVYGSVSV